MRLQTVHRRGTHRPAQAVEPVDGQSLERLFVYCALCRLTVVRPTVMTLGDFTF